MQGRFGGRFEDDGAGVAGVEGFFPASRANAPAIAGLESGESVKRHRGAEVIAARLAEGEEFFVHFAADRVAAAVLGPHLAFAVAIESGDRIRAAGDEDAADYVFVFHDGPRSGGKKHFPPVNEDDLRFSKPCAGRHLSLRFAPSGRRRSCFSAP